MLTAYKARTPSEFNRCAKLLGIAGLSDDFARFLLQFHSYSSAQNHGLDINHFLQMAAHGVIITAQSRELQK